MRSEVKRVQAEWLKRLRSAGLVSENEVEWTPLEGGVSSDIYLLSDGATSIVIKRALEKLKVKADWSADLSRNAFEQAFIRYVAAFRPDAVPRILYGDPEAGFFCMEFLDGYRNWKDDLLAGNCTPALAHRAGRLLGEIHAASWNDPVAERNFNAAENFDQLRIDPYLRATAGAHPSCSTAIMKEAGRLRQNRRCLIHGDYSPKNILHRDDRLVLLDCEVACYADPAFDLAFLLNHFFLKSLYHAPEVFRFSKMCSSAIAGYRETNTDHADEVTARSAELLPMLLLARIDGKSPVEYLQHEEKKEFARSFAIQWIHETATDPAAIQGTWFALLGEHRFHENNNR